MIETILPATVTAAESTGRPVADPPPYAEEAALLADATAKRRAEFSSGRACGRVALAGLGLPAGPIARAPGGGPLWPSGVVGSITHCAGYRAAATGRRTTVTAIGIDAEPHRPLRAGLLDLITSPAERARLAGPGEVCWDRLLFSAKESVYKVWYPHTGRWLDFADAEVEFSRDTNEFIARLRVPSPLELAELTGRWLVTGGLAITAIVVPAAGC